jgi:hypothetical protein
LQLRLRRIGCSRSTLKIPDPDDTGGIPTCTEAVPTCAEPVLTMGSTATPALTIRSSRVRLRLVARDTHRPANPSFSRELHALTRAYGHARHGTVELRVIVTSSPPSWLCSQPRCMGVPGEGEGIRLVGHRSPPGRNAGPITVIVSAYLEPRAHAVTSERGRCRYWGATERLPCIRAVLPCGPSGWVPFASPARSDTGREAVLAERRRAT